MQCTQDFAAFGNLIGSQLKVNGTPSPFNLDDAIVWYHKWLNIQLKLNVQYQIRLTKQSFWEITVVRLL